MFFALFVLFLSLLLQKNIQKILSKKLFTNFKIKIMKKLLFIIALLVCATGFSQTSPFNHSQAPMEIKQCLDSVIINNIDNSYYNTQKFLFTYNNTGKITILINYKKIGNIFWVPDYKQKNKYDKKGNRTERITYLWDVAIEKWNEESKDEISYDNHDNRVLNIIYFWNTDKEDWIEDSYYKTGYDDKGNIILTEDYVWNTDKKDWEKYGKWEYAYDENGFITLRARFEAVNNAWIPSGPSIYENDKFGNVLLYINYSRNGDTIVENTKETNEYIYFEGADKIQHKYHEYFNWDTEDNDWIISSKDKSEYNKHGKEVLTENYYWDSDLKDWSIYKNKYDYTYDSHENLTKTIAYYWDGDSSKWFEMYKEEHDYTYSGSGKVTQWITDWYSWEDKKWVLNSKSKSIYDYDTNGNEILKEDYYWDFDKKSWIGSNKNDFEFDLSYAVSDLILYDEGIPQSSLLEIMNMPLEERYYNWNDGWKTRTVITYYWSAKDINAVHDIAKSDFFINVFPNPVSDILNIETPNSNIIPEIKIYSIQGALLLHTKGNRMDVSALSNGIYIANINGVCKKIVKK